MKRAWETSWNPAFLTSAYLSNCCMKWWCWIWLSGKLSDTAATTVTSKKVLGDGGCRSCLTIQQACQLEHTSGWSQFPTLNSRKTNLRSRPLSSNWQTCLPTTERSACGLSLFLISRVFSKILYIIWRHQGAAFNMHETPGNSGKGGMSAF